jgi:hypothetical protein
MGEEKTLRASEIVRGVDGFIQDMDYDMNLIGPFVKVKKGGSNKDVYRYQKRVEEHNRRKMSIDGDKATGLLDEIASWLRNKLKRTINVS